MSISDLASPAGPSIHFHNESIEFQLADAEKVSSWLQAVAQAEQKEVGNLNFIFCSDEYLHQINVEYLQHDTFTDVISFPYATDIVEGDVFISIERIRENAELYKVAFEQELYRVMVHGTLHLIGFEDKSPEDKKRMTQKEDQYLDLLYKTSV
ncbi:MAG: rRNA maturation RNase YbeY [Bacteroidota bacterium]